MVHPLLGPLQLTELSGMRVHRLQTSLPAPHVTQPMTWLNRPLLCLSLSWDVPREAEIPEAMYLAKLQTVGLSLDVLANKWHHLHKTYWAGT